MLTLLSKKPLTWLLIALTVWLAIVLYWSRGFFLNTYDLKYMEHLYDHSQWRIPLSPRVIADDQIYPIAGVHQFKTGELFTINPEVPPLGKYLYGFGALWLGNPYLVSILLYLGTIFVFYQICKLCYASIEEKRSSHLAALATLLLASSFLMITQITQTMLDLPQLFFLALAVWFLLLIPRVKTLPTQLLLVAAGGLCVGLLSAIKFAAFTPAIGLVCMWWLRKHKPLITLPVLGFFTGLGFFLPYIQFVLNQPNIIVGVIEWLKTQKWVLDFYANSKIPTHYGMVLIATLSGQYKGWWADAHWGLVNEHSILWPTGIGSLIWTLLNFRKGSAQRSRSLVFVSFLGAALLAMMVVVPFWPRYFLILLPWGVLTLVLALKNHPRVIMAIVISSMIHATWMSQPLPHGVASRVQLYFNEGLYQDMYSIVDAKTQSQWTRDAFFTHMKHAERDLQTEWRFADVSVPKTWPWQNKVTGQATFRWHTSLEVIQTHEPITFVKENNTWKVVWEWDHIIPNYTPEDKIVFQSANHPQGTLRTSDGWIISQPGTRQEVLMVPDNVRNTAEVLAKVAAATNTKAIEIEKKLFIDSLPDEPVSIGIVALGLPKEQIDELSTLPGVALKNVQNRAFSPWVFANPTLLDTAQHADGDYDQMLPEIGGKIYLIKPDGSEVILKERPGKAGVNVTLDRAKKDL
jgi:hypothetical protein